MAQEPESLGELRRASIDLRERGIDASQAADIRAKFRTFADDWNRSEMDAYDEAGRENDEWKLAAEEARRIAREMGIDQAAIDKAVYDSRHRQ